MTETVPDWLVTPHRGDRQQFSGLLRSCMYMQDRDIYIEDEAFKMHNLGELLSASAERLDEAHIDWLELQALKKAAAKPSPPPTVPRWQDDFVEACMCIWEYAQEDEDFRQWLSQEEGAAQARTMVIDYVADHCETAYAIARYRGYESCFDWEFVPDFCRYLMTLDLLPTQVQPHHAIAAGKYLTR